MTLLTRRRFLSGSACLVAGLGLTRSARGSSFGQPLGPVVSPGPAATVARRFVAAERPGTLPCFGGIELPMWTFSDETWLAVVRMNLGERLEVEMENRLPRPGEHTSIHWHGIRLPNNEDGVPFLVQPPVLPGENFRYSFVPPDAGTFFFHSHCNTAEQLGRGMAGVLIVDGDTTEPYAADATIMLRDWLVDEDKRTFRPFFTNKGAARGGTFGNVRSANGETETDLNLPASADCRIRLINGDPTRVMEISVAGAEAAVIAIDGIAVPPFPLTTWLLGPAMRLDLVVRTPAEGGAAQILDQRPADPLALVRIVGVGAAEATRSFDPKPLRAPRIPEPDIASAERMSFVFGAAGQYGAVVAANDPFGGLTVGSLCLSLDEFWTINNAAWPTGDRAKLPPPLARLAQDRSYVFELKNSSQLIHPIHIHGHTFKVLRSDKRAPPVHHADTVLLLPDETIEVAFVADNPGRWMFHCHVIEHQETGMMGYVEVA